MARSQLRDARVHETATAVAERGKDLGAKGWSFIKGVYGTVATQVESVAKDNGYKLDLGTAFLEPPNIHISHLRSMVCLMLLLKALDVLLVRLLHHPMTTCELGSIKLACNYTACRACTESSSHVSSVQAANMALGPTPP